MRATLLVSLLAIPAALVAAKDAQQQLVDLAAANGGIIDLDATTYDLLTASQRNWSSTIQFTALDKRRRCTPCVDFNPSYVAVAKAWASAPKADRDNHFFAILDFDKAPTVFQKLGLTSAPVLHVLSPTEGPRRPASGRTGPITYDFSNGFEAGPLAASLSNHTPIPIPYKEPINWSRWITGIAGLLTFAVTLRFISPILQSRWVWALGTISTSLIMTSGFMFTRIRGVPYTGAGGNWIAAGYQNQFGQEVHVIAAIYAFLSFSFLMLILVVPYQSSPGRQRIQVYLWSFIIMFVYSILITLFKVKNRGYPFRLFL